MIFIHENAVLIRVPPQGGTAGVQWLIAIMESDIQTVPPSGGTRYFQRWHERW